MHYTRIMLVKKYISIGQNCGDTHTLQQET